MITEQSWLANNLSERLSDPSVDLKIEINVESYEEQSFNDAVDALAHKLSGEKLCIGLSGGIDSEYLVRKFHSLGIQFETVIVDSECYRRETSIAYQICHELAIKPTVLEVSQTDIIKRYKVDIFDKFNSYGIGGVPALLVGEYAEKNDLIYLKAEHMIDDIDGVVAVGVNEWDFYTDVLYTSTMNFFMHDPNIIFAMTNEMRSDENSQAFKCRLYKIPFREKIYLTIPYVFKQYIRTLRDTRKHKPISSWQMLPHDFIQAHFTCGKLA